MVETLCSCADFQACLSRWNFSSVTSPHACIFVNAQVLQWVDFLRDVAGVDVTGSIKAKKINA
jgi:hypothetical protein